MKKSISFIFTAVMLVTLGMGINAAWIKAADAESAVVGKCDPSILEDIQREKADLQTKKAEIAAYEKEVKAKEAALNDQLNKLTLLKKDIEQTQESKNKNKEERVAKLVETLETMSPKSGASLLKDMDNGLAIEAMARMSTLKLAKVMAALDPKRATELAELLNGLDKKKLKEGKS